MPVVGGEWGVADFSFLGLRSRVTAGVMLVIGVGMVALGAGFLVNYAPDGTRDLHAYQSAARCETAPSKPADCRWTREFTVSEINLTSSRSHGYRVALTDGDGVRWKTEYGKRKPVLTDLKKGDRVTGTVWRGHVTEIAAKGGSQKTDDAPADMRARALIVALMIVPSGLVMAAACVWRLVRRGEPTPGMVATLVLSIALFITGLCSPLIGGEKFWTDVAVWLPVAVVMAVVAGLYVRTKRGAAALQ